MDPLSYFLATDLAAANNQLDQLTQELQRVTQQLHQSNRDIDELLARSALNNHLILSQRNQLQRANRTINRQRNILLEHGLARTLPPSFLRVARRIDFNLSDSDSEIEEIDLTSD